MAPSVTIGWCGLGAMGSGMVSSLLSQKFSVKAYDIYQPSVDAVVQRGAIPCSDPKDAAVDVDVLGLMVVNAAQVEDIVTKVSGVLKPNASIICFSTVPPSFLSTLQSQLDKAGRGIQLVDAPVSGGFIRAADGELSIMAAAVDEALQRTGPVLRALTRSPGKLAVVGTQVGQASDFKLINQVLCAIHIAAASEAMALAANLGVNPRKLYNALQDSSFMFGHRVPWQLRDDGLPKSAMTIICKDVGIVMDEARLIGFPAPLSSASEQLFGAALGAGLAKDDDANLVKLWQKFGGKSVVESGTIDEEEALARAAVGGEEHIATVSKLLYAVHTVAAAEALAFARQKNMDLEAVFDVVSTSAASSQPLVDFKDELSWPNDHSPKKGQLSVQGLVSQLDGVLAEGKRTSTPLFLTQAAYQQLLVAARKGWGTEGASVVGRLWSQ